MSDYQTYIDRKRARKSVQREAAEILAKVYASKGPQIKDCDRNVFVYFAELPNTRFKVGPTRTWREYKRKIDAADDRIETASTMWIVKKIYKTSGLAKIDLNKEPA